MAPRRARQSDKILALLLASMMLSIPLPVAAADPPTSWNFDDGLQGWTQHRLVGAFGSGLILNTDVWDPASPAVPGWHLSEFGARGGSGLGWIFDRELIGLYGDFEDTWIISPSLDLSASPGAQLTFWLRGEVEDGFDFMFVESRTGTGAWTKVAEFTGNKGDWAQYSVGFGPAAGASNAQVRFHFVSDFAFFFEGYALDDIAITGSGGPTASLSSDVRNIDEGQSISFTTSVTAGDDAVTSAVLDFGDGSSTSVATSGSDTVSHTYSLPGVYNAVLTATDSASATATSLLTVTAEDTAAYGTRVVVAIIDTGANPYHETYRRPGVNLPLGDFLNASDGAAPRVVNLNFTSDHPASLASDAGTWAGISAHELVYFAGTNLLGISFDARDGAPRVRDPQGHGTATTSTVLAAFPDAIIVIIQPETDGTAVDLATLAEGLRWAASQPWIDVISVSVGALGNVPLGGTEAPEASRAAYEAGKLVFMSAGNDPSPLPTDSLDGAPWVISVTGTQEGGQAREIMASTVYPDVASNYTVIAAARNSHNGTVEISGTSFSSPTAAGSMAGAIHALRAASSYMGGISGGELVPSVADNLDLRAAMNKSAYYNEWLDNGGYLFGIHALGDVGVFPVVPWAEVGWGQLDARFTDDIVAVVDSGDYTLPAPPAEKGIAKPYMEANYALRAAYWRPQADRDAYLSHVEGPGPDQNVVAITPVETPHPYGNNVDITWTITQPGASAVSVHFEDFSVEASFDFASVEDAGGNVFATYSLEGGADFWSAYVPGDTVVVRLASDSSVQLYGFVINEIDAPSA